MIKWKKKGKLKKLENFEIKCSVIIFGKKNMSSSQD